MERWLEVVRKMTRDVAKSSTSLAFLGAFRLLVEKVGNIWRKYRDLLNFLLIKTHFSWVKDKDTLQKPFFSPFSIETEAIMEFVNYSVTPLVVRFHEFSSFPPRKS